jgi:type II secretory pathway component PulC
MVVTKSQKRLFILLGAVVLYAAYDFISNKDDYEKMYAGKKQVVQSKPSKNVQLMATQETRRITDLDMDFKKDPFFRDDLVKKVVKYRKSIKPKTKPLKLQAITYSDANSFVMINDLILSEGEYVEGYVVEKIEKTRVRLSKDGKSMYLNSK